jgi:N-acyl-D-aspartate/D-glutamate deacylase
MRTFTLTILLLMTSFARGESFDLVLHGGRVVDPESGLDAIRDVGIANGKIVRISQESLIGRQILDAEGLVVAPGFIDLHQHDQDLESTRLKAFDGVTTALEMEIGVPNVAAFLEEKKGHSLINYGTSASHCAARALAFGAPIPPGTILPQSGPSTNEPASEAQLRAILNHLGQELDAGAIGIGMGIQYTPGASRSEVIQVFRLAAARGVPVFTHVRSFGRLEPGSSIESVSEVIAAATISGASLHIVHVNSSCLKDSLECLSLIAGARARGIDVTTEAYPYVAGMTYINSALFNPGWRERLGIDYSALRLPESGEVLTKARFDELHASSQPQRVLEFINSDEMVDAVIRDPLVMVASDGEHEHPRNAGTYSKVLARFVRQQQTLTLMDAIRKMSYMPALRLEKATPAGRFKGRLQVGADADVIAFDLGRVTDRSTYAKPIQESEGMKFVIVGGTVLIDDGTLRRDTYPGRALRETRN